MKAEALIARAIRAAVKTEIPVIVTEGVVVSVDRATQTCNVEREHKTELFNVRLNAFLEAGDDVLTIYPKEGSKVLCIIIENDPTDAYILNSTDIEEISGQIGGAKLNWTKDGFVLNGGEIGGLVKASELKTQLEKLTARVDGIINAIKTAVPVTGDGGAGLQTTMKAALALLIEKESFASLENNKVKH